MKHILRIDQDNVSLSVQAIRLIFFHWTEPGIEDLLPLWFIRNE